MIKKVVYFIDGKKKVVEAKKVGLLSTGLMFRRKSPPLLFTLPSEMRFSIFSLFCKPFKAIWLDEKMCATKIVDVKTWRLNISGRGKFLLEIPSSVVENRKV